MPKAKVSISIMTGDVGLRSKGRKLRPESISKRDVKKQDLPRKLEVEKDRDASQEPSKAVVMNWVGNELVTKWVVMNSCTQKEKQSSKMGRSQLKREDSKT